MPEHADAPLLYVSGELSPKDRKDFEAHALACGECRAALLRAAWGSRLAESAAREASNVLSERAARLARAPAFLRPKWPGYAAALALAAVLFAALPRAPEHLEWRNGLESGISRLRYDLDAMEARLADEGDALELREGITTLQERLSAARRKP